ncbi:spindle assembly abnormal protein 7-like isoform X1 [Plodia interpunctella]|uniref:spindle assembly abnormal protein 7-like isoform X1 n=1 Tax=Plodia interpunctella TaxID=58824 RepID=UPI0023679F9A|nr:centrosomal protein of 112 kDa-like isoform X1 [Plodia interpunctella]
MVMESKEDNSCNILNDKYQTLIACFSKCKIEFQNEKEERKKLSEINAKLEIELKEARELEKSHRYHLLSCREMIGNLQETVSQLVYLKRDVKKLKDELCSKSAVIVSMEKDKENILLKHAENVTVLKEGHEKHIEELTAMNDRKIQQVQYESDTQVAQFSCVIEELRSKIKEIESEHRDKMNVVVLEYEEKLQRGAAQIAQMQEQLARQAARTESSMDAYRRKLEDLEEKLKQSQFKEYLAQNTYASQYETQVERPYSMDRDPYPIDFETNFEPIKSQFNPSVNHNKPKSTNTLQVMYYGNKPPCAKGSDKKGQFNITKKRKLYNEKDFQDC